MEGYTPEDLAAAGLSPEEIAAMADESPAEEGTPAVVPPEAEPAPEGEGGAPAQVAAPEVPPAPEEAAPVPPDAEPEAPAAPVEEPPAAPDKPRPVAAWNVNICAAPNSSTPIVVKSYI